MQEDVFYALAVETHGCLGEEFQRFMRKCARRNAAIGILEVRFATEEDSGDRRVCLGGARGCSHILSKSKWQWLRHGGVRRFRFMIEQCVPLGVRVSGLCHPQRCIYSFSSGLFTVMMIAGGSEVARWIVSEKRRMPN